jgi:hypothetical protein
LAVKKLDKALADVNFDVGISLKSVYLGLTADNEDLLIQNQTLVELGIDNQSIHLSKEDFKCKVSVFGISVTTLNSFEMLYTAVNKMKKIAKMYSDNLAVETSMSTYKEFIKNIYKSLDKKREKQRAMDMKD